MSITIVEIPKWSKPIYADHKPEKRVIVVGISLSQQYSHGQHVKQAFDAANDINFDISVQAHYLHSRLSKKLMKKRVLGYLHTPRH